MTDGDSRAQGTTRTSTVQRPKRAKAQTNSSTKTVFQRTSKPVTSKKRSFQRINVIGLSALSVFRVALIFYSFMALIFLIAGAIVWEIVSKAGLVLKLDHLIRSLTGSPNYAVKGTQVLIVAVGFLVVLVAIGSVLTAIAVRIFNIVAEMVGGIGLNIRSGASNSAQSG